MLKPQTRPIDPKDMIFETTESICLKSVLKLNGRINPSQSLNPWFFTIPLQKSANTANIPHTHDEFNRQNTRCYRQTKRICKNSISEPHPPKILSKNLQLYTQIRHNAQFSQKKTGCNSSKATRSRHPHAKIRRKPYASPTHHQITKVWPNRKVPTNDYTQKNRKSPPNQGSEQSQSNKR